MSTAIATPDDYEEPSESTAIVPAAPSNRTTPEQAKTDAIASLTMKAYDRASTLELTGDEAKKLLMDFPDEAFRPGAGGKDTLIYIEHAFLRDRLTEVFGMGKWSIVPRSRWQEEFMTSTNKRGVRVYVEAMLVVRGCFVAESIGEMEYYPHNAAQNYGDAVEGAKSAAFRRCCKEFGVGLQAWKKGWCEGWWQRRNQPKQTMKPAHQCTTLAELNAAWQTVPDDLQHDSGPSFHRRAEELGGVWTNGQGFAPKPMPVSEEDAAFLAKWQKILDAELVNIDKLNTQIVHDFKAIPGKHPCRAKVWSMIAKFAENNGCVFNKSTNLFVQAEAEPGEQG